MPLPKNCNSSVFLEIFLQFKYGFESFRHYDKEEECQICLDNMLNEYVIKCPCGHIFHRSCIMTNIYVHEKTKCPYAECSNDYESLDEKQSKKNLKKQNIEHEKKVEELYKEMWFWEQDEHVNKSCSSSKMTLSPIDKDDLFYLEI